MELGWLEHMPEDSHRSKIPTRAVRILTLSSMKMQTLANIVEEYNYHMAGVDLMTSLIRSQKISISRISQPRPVSDDKLGEKITASNFHSFAIVLISEKSKAVH